MSYQTTLRPIAFTILFFLAVLPVQAQDTIDYIPLAELEPGMKGYGLTVFEGSRIDTFTVEVVGVQEGIRAAGSILLIEVGGHGLEKSAIAQGMSGSPVFVEGRFAGALAFGWGGALRPIAGVTPAAEILALPDRPVGGSMPEKRSVEPDLGTLVSPSLTGEALAAEVFGTAGTTAPAVAAFDGLHGWPAADEVARHLMASWLPDFDPADPTPSGWVCRPTGMAAGGTGGASSGGTLEPGSACSIPLIGGDAQLGVLGTVTRVDGDRVLMMGHPFLQRGPVDLPLATAEILTLFPSRQMSFKMGTLGDVVGTVHSDQRAGLAGTLGPAPRTIPVGVEVVGEGGDVRTYQFEVVDDPQFTPGLVFWGLYNALLVEGDDASRQTLRYRMESTWSGHDGLNEPLVLSGVAAGPGGAVSLAAEWMAPLGVLLNNAHQELTLEGVTARFEISRPMETVRIVGLSAPRVLPPPGTTMDVTVEIEALRGERSTVTVPVTLPATLTPGPYRLVAASAAELFALEAQRAAGRFLGPSLDNLITLLRTERAPSALAVALFAPGESVVVQGAELSNLPPSRSRLLRQGNMQAMPVMAEYILRIDRDLSVALSGNAVRNVQLNSIAEPMKEERRP